MNFGFVSGYLGSDVTLSTTCDGLTKAVLTLAEGQRVPAGDGEGPEAEVNWTCVVALGPVAEQLAPLGRGSFLEVRYTLRRQVFEVGGEQFYFSQPLANEVHIVSAEEPGEPPVTGKPSP